MKKFNILYVVMSAVTIVAMTFLSGCHKDEPESPTSINGKILSSHDWKLQSLSVDGVDKTSLYSGMTLSFTTNTYSTTNGAPVWALTGTWSFPGTDATIIMRDDQTEVHVDQITQDQLVLSLTWNKNTFGSGRSSSINGRHTYTFVK
jgi:hypothetical protein